MQKLSWRHFSRHFGQFFWRPFWQFFYNVFILPSLLFLFFSHCLISTKSRRGLKGRIGSTTRLHLKCLNLKCSGPGSISASISGSGIIEKKKAWFHVSSVGEYLQAKPVITQLKVLHPDLIVVLTVSSPSAHDWLKNKKSSELEIDIIEYYPLDWLPTLQAYFKLIQPTIVVLTKFDIWPNLVWKAHKHKIPIYLISGTLHEKSARFNNKLGRSFYSTLYECFHTIFAVNNIDLNRFKASNPTHPRILLGGDTRVDSVLERQKRESLQPLSLTESVVKNDLRKILCVGSSWPNDEEIIFSKHNELKAEIKKNLLILLVPHETSPQKIKASENRLKHWKLQHLLWSDFEKNPSPEKLQNIQVLIVDKVGMLARIYQIADLAYVGAGPGGLHNIMEPAAWKLTVVFGPLFHNSPEAIALNSLGCAFSLIDSMTYTNFLNTYFAQDHLLREWGEKSRHFLENSAGSARSCAITLSDKLS